MMPAQRTSPVARGEIPVVLRATGFADAMLATPEPKVLAHAARFYALSEPAGLEWFSALAERWRPFRTWATVLIRLAGDRGTSLPDC
jgi:DNA-3-methyladenine glycosylase II